MKYSALFLFFMLFSLVVESIDIYCSIKFQEQLINGGELNPVGIWLIALDNNSVALFMSLKFTVFCIAFSLITLLGEKASNWAFGIATFMFIWHTALLCVLLW